MGIFDNLEIPQKEQPEDPLVKECREKIEVLQAEINESAKELDELCKKYGPKRKMDISKQWVGLLVRLKKIDVQKRLELFGKVSCLMDKQKDLFGNWVDTPDFWDKLDVLQSEYKSLFQEAILLEALNQQASQNAEDTKTREKETSDGFSVKNGQVFYEGKDLGFPAGQIQDFFGKLIESLGLTVKYTELEKITTIEKIRGYKYQASKILKDHSVPYEITSLTNEGYVLRSKSE